MKKNSKAYQEGLAAAKFGATPRLNPYVKGEQAYEDWLDGLIDGSL